MIRRKPYYAIRAHHLLVDTLSTIIISSIKSATVDRQRANVSSRFDNPAETYARQIDPSTHAVLLVPQSHLYFLYPEN